MNGWRISKKIFSFLPLSDADLWQIIGWNVFSVKNCRKFCFFKFSNEKILPAYFLPKNSIPGAKNSLIQAILRFLENKDKPSCGSLVNSVLFQGINEEWLELDYFWHRESNFWAKNRREQCFYWKIWKTKFSTIFDNKNLSADKLPKISVREW